MQSSFRGNRFYTIIQQPSGPRTPALKWPANACTWPITCYTRILNEARDDPEYAETDSQPRGPRRFGPPIALNVQAQEVRKKRSSEKGEARAKIIAALSLHHKYQKGSCLNLEPIGSNELARQAKVGTGSASRFFEAQFDGYKKYEVVCRDPSRLADSLRVLNGEFSPTMLYGRTPPGEGTRGEDE